MTFQIDLHPAQAEMLRVLLFKPRAGFSELNVTGLSNDHFSFHLKRLVEVGLIDKSASGHYELSVKGKEFANRMDTETVKVETQAKSSALIVCTRKHNNVTEFLLQKRLKQPYYGFHGFVGGKIRWGEFAVEAGKRELWEETGLSGEPQIVGIEHKVDYDVDGKLLEDKFLYVMKVVEPKGELKDHEGGKNVWVAEDEVEKLDKLFQDVLDIIKVVRKRGVQVIEKRFLEKEY
jgi:ADP-ribose pyrophosphatase YjhB (NUDIX family)